MILLRYLLIGLIVYLIARAFVKFGDGQDKGKNSFKRSDKQPGKKISKEVGEYIDYEDVKK